MSLQDLCYKNIAQSVLNMPPQLQESIIGKTKEHVKKTMKKEATKQALFKVKQEMCDILPYIVPEIIQDIIHAMTTNGAVRQNYYFLYKNLRKEIIDTAIKIAEYSVTYLEERYVHPAFDIDEYDDIDSEFI
jgi:hypothetical protein